MDKRAFRIAVVGCGVVGESWSALFLSHGFDVDAWDPEPQVREQFAARLERPLAELAALNSSPSPTGALRIVNTLAEAVKVAGLIQENAPERVPLKRRLYADIEAAVPAAAIIASSTSVFT